MRLNSSLLRLLRAGALALVAVWLAGCASLVGDPRHPVDPFEPMNRKVMSFNDDLDKAVIKPVALAYRDRVPRPVRVGVSNVLGNIADVWSFFNSTLQLKMHQAAELGGRVAINSVFGLGGLIDVASEFGLEHRVVHGDGDLVLNPDDYQLNDALQREHCVCERLVVSLGHRLAHPDRDVVPLLHFNCHRHALGL